MRKLSMEALHAGLRPRQDKRPRPLKVSGVGQGAQQAAYDCRVPICCKQTNGDMTRGTFLSPTVSNSELPGLLGLHAMRQMRGILDMYNNKLHFVGPGDLDWSFPPGTETFDLIEAPSGHLLLPCNLYSQAAMSKSNIDAKELTLLAETAIQSPPGLMMQSVPQSAL